MKREIIQPLTRRRFIRDTAALGALAGIQGLLPSYAFGTTEGVAAKPGDIIDLVIREEKLSIAGKRAVATSINGTVPGPLVRLKEGSEAVLRVANELKEDSSIHWHGIILPFKMDGVPGLSFEGIRADETFEYRFPVRQNGTYWYHSHSGLQEQTGVYGPLIVDSAGPEPWAYDREYVVVLSDWTFEDPHWVLGRLKKQSDYFNDQQQTVLDLIRKAKAEGVASTAGDQLMWSLMRMMPSDIADVTGKVYTKPGSKPKPPPRMCRRLVWEKASTMSNWDFGCVTRSAVSSRPTLE